MGNCVECGAPIDASDASDACGACGAQRGPATTNGTSHPRFEDPDGLIYEDSPLLRADEDDAPASRDQEREEQREPQFVREPLRDDPSVRAPAFTTPATGDAADEPAGFGSRAVALVIDFMILSLLDVALFALATAAVVLAERVSGARVGGAVDLVSSSISAGSLTLFIGYFSVLHARSGQTLGKVAMRIRVQDADGARLAMPASVLRTLAYVLSALPFGAGFLLALGPKRLALHDHLAGSVVVRDRGNA